MGKRKADKDLYTSLEASSFFVLGTDTGVGKTEVTKLLSLELLSNGEEVCPVKPVVTGVKSPGSKIRHYEDLEELSPLFSEGGREAYQKTLGLDTLTPIYGFKKAMAPYTASILDGDELNFRRLRSRLLKLKTHCDRQGVRMVIEGVGGIYVPLNTRKLFVDLVKSCGLPAIVVTRTELGTINHTLLTIDALAKHDIPVQGLVFNRFKSGKLSEVEKASVSEILAYTKAIKNFYLCERKSKKGQLRLTLL